MLASLLRLALKVVSCLDLPSYLDEYGVGDSKRLSPIDMKRKQESQENGSYLSRKRFSRVM